MENRICRRSLAVYLALWAFFVAAFWLRLDACGLLYGLAAFYIVLPLAALGVCALCGRYGGPWRFALPFALAAGQVLLGMLTFSLSNTLSFGQWNLPELGHVPFTLVPALVGLAIGAALRAFSRRRGA
ncbi:hypothetical protein D3Z52_01140 [Clostridiaceae bacterium]|jgi:hypothetical protein|nr:hypothetical protein [Clostridiaceae bacterium]NBI82439.1 hypothetical protein [Clostridiaceae bacterium]